jgi:hypothetical protein
MSDPKRRRISMDVADLSRQINMSEDDVLELARQPDIGWTVTGASSSSDDESVAEVVEVVPLTKRKMIAEQAYNEACAALYRPHRMTTIRVVPVIRCNVTVDDDHPFVLFWRSKTSLACAFFTNRILIEALQRREVRGLDTETILEMDTESALLREALNYVTTDPSDIEIEYVPIGTGLDKDFCLKDEYDDYTMTVCDALYTTTNDGLIVRPLDC